MNVGIYDQHNSILIGFNLFLVYPLLFIPSLFTSSCFQRATLTATAVQQFFVPLPEASLMKDGFYAINPIAGQELSSGWGYQQKLICAAGIVNTMIGITISTDGTVVFWGTSMFTFM